MFPAMRLGVATATCCLGILLASESHCADKATIAVLPFEVSDAASAIETSALVDAFNRVLVNTRKFTVVDRARVDRTRREQKFGGSGLVSPGSAAAAGRLIGAQFLVMGTVVDYSVDPPREMAYGSGWTRPVRISANVQVVDASSGQIVAARRASASAQVRVSDPRAAGAIPNQALEQAGERVAEDCIRAILDAAYPAKIVSVEGDEVRLNRGEGGGLGVGTELDCFAAGKNLYDPDTKELLGTNDRFQASVAITEVLTTMSVGRIVGGASLRTGDTCRAKDDGGTGTRREPPPAGPIHSY